MIKSVATKMLERGIEDNDKQGIDRIINENMQLYTEKFEMVIQNNIQSDDTPLVIATLKMLAGIIEENVPEDIKKVANVLVERTIMIKGVPPKK